MKALSTESWSESHVFLVPEENKIIKFYWNLDDVDIKRYALLQNYVANLWTIELFLEEIETGYEYILITSFLKLGAIWRRFSYWLSGAKAIECFATEQEYIKWWFLDEIMETELPLIIADRLNSEGIKYVPELLASWNMKVTKTELNGKIVVNIVITDMATSIKQLLVANKDFIDNIF